MKAEPPKGLDRVPTPEKRGRSVAEIEVSTGLSGCHSVPPSLSLKKMPSGLMDGPLSLKHGLSGHF